jgi:hypothetical protein
MSLRRGIPRARCAALLMVLSLARVGRAQDGAPPDLLDGVAWIGPGASLGDLRGKTVVVLTYVTWCPKCNVWAPDLFRQVKAAAADKPMVVVAVCTDAPTIPGPKYVSDKGLVGPNILHAYDAGMDEKLRLDGKALFNGMIIGPDRQIVWKGGASSYYEQDGGAKEFVVALRLREVANPGAFTIVKDDMPDDVRGLLWPMEFGRVLPDRDLNRAKRKLSPQGRAALDEAVGAFVSRQLEIINELREGEAPQQMAAFAKADLLAKAYPTTDEGKAARQLVVQLNRDTQFKKEIAARNAYEQLLARTADQPQARQNAQLEGFIKRFEGTYYASQAVALLDKENSDRTSSAGDPMAVTP